MPDPSLSHQELFSTSVQTLSFAPGTETRSENSENFRCVRSISAPLLSLSLVGFLHLESSLLILCQSWAFQERGISGISGISPGGFGELLLSVGVRVQEVLDTPLPGSTRSSQLCFSLEEKARKRVLPLPWERRILAPAAEKFVQLRDVESQNILSWN